MTVSRPARLLAVVALTVAVSLVAVTSASAARYPKEVRSAFVKQCYKSAKRSAQGEVPNRKLRKACKVSLRCIQRKLSLQEFSEADVSDRPVQRCINKGARSITAGTAAG